MKEKLQLKVSLEQELSYRELHQKRPEPVKNRHGFCVILWLYQRDDFVYDRFCLLRKVRFTVH